MSSFDRQLRSLARRARLGVARGILRLVSDADGLQTAQVGLMANETRSGIERIQEYGFTSVPKAGAEAAVVFIGGERGNGLIIAVDDRRYRLKGLAEGEVAIYTDEGDKIHLKRGNKIEVTTGEMTITATEKVRMDTPLLEVQGEIIDRYETNGDTMQGMRVKYNSHVHDENDSGGPTDAPQASYLMDT